MKSDPAIETVRAARAEISREAGNDPARLIAHYIELQRRYAGQILPGPEAEDVAAQQTAAADGASRRS